MTATFRFKACDLWRLLAGASSFACAGPGCPSLHAVRFGQLMAGSGQYLFVAAASRHVLSYEEAWPVEAVGSGSVSPGAADAWQLVAANPRKAAWWLGTTVAYEPGYELITVTADNAGAPLRFREIPGAFPDARREIGCRVDGTRATIVFNPGYLALLAKVEVQTRRGNRSWRISSSRLAMTGPPAFRWARHSGPCSCRSGTPDKPAACQAPPGQDCRPGGALVPP